MKILNRQSPPAALDLMPEIDSAGRGGVEPGYHPSYRLALWSFLIFNYQGRIRLENEWFEVRPGCAFLTSPGVFKHHFPAEKSFHYFVQLTFPTPPPTPPVYCFFDLESAYGEFCAGCNELLIYRQSDPLRARVRLWDLLQRLKDAGGDGNREPLPLRRAAEFIEVHLGGTLDLAELAARCEVTPSYLVRLFRRYRGTTVSGYVRRRRLELARSLLVNSDLPVREIAAQVGLPDLQYFNKVVRATCGRSPRALRAAARGEEG